MASSNFIICPKCKAKLSKEDLVVEKEIDMNTAKVTAVRVLCIVCGADIYVRRAD